MGARDVLAELAGVGVTVIAEGGALVIRPASKLTDALRQAVREAKPELLALVAGGHADAVMPLDVAAVTWTDADMAAFTARHERLMRWGWPEAEAERMAERLVLRDRARDERVCCVECAHCRPGRCGNHRRAGLSTVDLSNDLAAALQRCPGFKAGG